MADQIADLPLENGYFRFLLIESYSERSDVADQVADLSPLENGYFRFLLIDSYSERSDVADQVADLPLHKMAIINLYCESSYVTAHIWQTSRSTPIKNAINRFVL